MNEEEYAAAIAEHKRGAREDVDRLLLAWRRRYWTPLDDPISREDDWRRFRMQLAYRQDVLLGLSVIDPKATFVTITTP